MNTSPVPSHLTAFFAEFEMQGEVAVRFAVEAGEYRLDAPRLGAAKAWLSMKEEERSNSLTAKRDAREEETLRIAKEALSSAKEANRIASEDLEAARASAAAAETQALSARTQARWAKWAAIIATVAAMAATSTQINELISYLHK